MTLDSMTIQAGPRRAVEIIGQQNAPTPGVYNKGSYTILAIVRDQTGAPLAFEKSVGSHRAFALHDLARGLREARQSVAAKAIDAMARAAFAAKGAANRACLDEHREAMAKAGRQVTCGSEQAALAAAGLSY